MDRIVHNLWLGSQGDADELVRNNPAGITAILNVRGPDAYDPPGRNQATEHPGKAYKWIPAPDIGVISVKHVKEALMWLREHTERGERILIHCKHGISRSPAILAAFMVESGISANLEEARATISVHRSVQPATQIAEQRVRPVCMISTLTGLPNRQAFDEKEASRFVALADIDLMKLFDDFYGHIAGDALLRRFAKILSSVGLEAYHDREDKFICRGESHDDLSGKLVQARQVFRKPFQVYADGRMQTIEEMSFSFGIGTSPDESKTALQKAKKAMEGTEPPEWVRQIIATGERFDPAALVRRFGRKAR